MALLIDTAQLGLQPALVEAALRAGPTLSRAKQSLNSAQGVYPKLMIGLLFFDRSNFLQVCLVEYLN